MHGASPSPSLLRPGDGIQGRKGVCGLAGKSSRRCDWVKSHFPPVTQRAEDEFPEPVGKALARSRCPGPLWSTLLHQVGKRTQQKPWLEQQREQACGLICSLSATRAEKKIITTNWLPLYLPTTSPPEAGKPDGFPTRFRLRGVVLPPLPFLQVQQLAPPAGSCPPEPGEEAAGWRRRSVAPLRFGHRLLPPVFFAQRYFFFAQKQHV